MSAHVSSGEKLLASDEPSPFEVISGDDASPFLITVDHGGRRLPRKLGSLGLSDEDLERHIAWDIGALGLGRCLAPKLGATLISQRYSRLVVDCNRPLVSPTLIATTSEDTIIVGNRSLSASEREARIAEIFLPYHEAIQSEVERRERESKTLVFVALHSFTPVYRGFVRPWHGGVLYQRDTRYAHAVLRSFRDEESLVIGDNEPYSVSDDSDYGVVIYGERRGHLHVELEVRQDLIVTSEGQSEWAARLERVLRQALRDQS